MGVSGTNMEDDSIEEPEIESPVTRVSDSSYL